LSAISPIGKFYTQASGWLNKCFFTN